MNQRLTLFGRYSHAPSEVVARLAIPNILNPQQYKTETATAGSTFRYHASYQQRSARQLEPHDH